MMKNVTVLVIDVSKIYNNDKVTRHRLRWRRRRKLARVYNERPSSISSSLRYNDLYI